MRMILNEAYFGKSKNIIIMEKSMESLSVMIKENPDKNYNKTKEMETFKKAMASEFGFERVIFVINPNFTMNNGYTFKFTHNKNSVDSHNNLEQVVTSKGIKYRFPDNKIVYIEMNGHILLEKTGKHAMALILHEVGHQFYVSTNCYKFGKLNSLMKNYLNYCKMFKTCLLSRKMSVKQIYQQTKFIMELSLKMKKLKKGLTDIDPDTGKPVPPPRNFVEYIESIEKVININYEELRNMDIRYKKAYDEYVESISKDNNKFMKALISIGRFLGAPLSYLTIIGIPGRLGGIEKDHIDDRNDEKFSDNFAASYGYAVEFAEMSKDWINDENTFLTNRDVKYRLKYKVLSSWLYYIESAPHPSSLYRLNFMRDKIEHELKNKNITPADKKELLEQIKEIEDIINLNKSEYQIIEEQLDEDYGISKKLDDHRHSDRNEDIFDFNVQRSYKKFSEDTILFIETTDADEDELNTLLEEVYN